MIVTEILELGLFLLMQNPGLRFSETALWADVLEPDSEFSSASGDCIAGLFSCVITLSLNVSLIYSATPHHPARDMVFPVWKMDHMYL